ncbi:hypothetical protein QFC21_001853 [Naganishia friedmannii]|uniref:Uncharacterized protein n=1 Tax=Naganishia friedmannii TaxID=89922 RepID=A0ACC2W4C4_9TREE|nr:hypothetical protein QFC21_001853 [Naganishia friedmannii]
MTESSESISHMLYVLAFDCPLPPLLSSIPAMCRFVAATLAIPFVFCMLLSPRDIRLSRSPLGSKPRGNPIIVETLDPDGIPVTAIVYPDDANALIEPTGTAFDQEPLDGPSQPATPLNYSPLSTRTSISSSSASAASSESSDEGYMTHHPHHVRSNSAVNSLGLMNEFDNEQPFANRLSQTHKRNPFAFEENDSHGVSREKTPRAFDITPSVNSIDEEGLLVPSTVDSAATSDTESDESVNEPMQFNIADASGTIPAPRQAAERRHTNDTTEIEGVPSAGMVLLGPPVQT